MKPTLQIALDFVNMSQAMRVAKEAAQAGATWLEAGTPLIKSEGLAAVRALKYGIQFAPDHGPIPSGGDNPLVVCRHCNSDSRRLDLWVSRRRGIGLELENRD